MPKSTEVSMGHVGPRVLTEEQQGKVRELWYEMGKLIGLDVDRIAAEHGTTALKEEMENSINSAATPSTPQKKSRFGSSKGQEASNDKHGSNKQYLNALSEMSHEELRNALWDFSKCDDPDSNLLRYLRARKWVVKDALVMLVSTIHWRNRIMKLDDDVLLYGEEDAVKIDNGEMEEVGGLSKKIAHDLVDQLRIGKSFVHGRDKLGRPMCFIRVKLHKIGGHSTESLERLIVYMIETARFMLDPPNLETVMVVFDMSEFGMRNMDYVPLKFIIKVFEANYPESLGAVLVHRAPWVFQSAWSVIKGWLDPVVAQKIHFTKDVSDLSQFIDLDTVPKDMGGNEDWKYEYPEPVEGENIRMGDTATRDRLQSERSVLLDQFEEATIKWVVSNGVNDEAYKAKRKELADKLYINYWQLDPYVRARTLLDRLGLIGPKFPVPDPTKNTTTSQVNGESKSETAAPAEKKEVANGAPETVNGQSNGTSTSNLANGAVPVAAAASVAAGAAVAQSHSTQSPRSPAKSAGQANAQSVVPVELDVQELGFKRPFTKEVEQKFNMRNTNSVPVVFKVKVTAPRQYLIRPCTGRLEPGQQMPISVFMQPLKEEPSANTLCGAKILIQSVAVSKAHKVNPTPEWWSTIEQIAASPIDEARLRVNFLPERTDSKVATTAGAATATAAGTAAAVGASADGSPSTEQLKAELAQAQTQIASLTRQALDAQRQRAAIRPAAPLPTATEGVPVHVVAGFCAMSAYAAYLLF